MDEEAAAAGPALWHTGEAQERADERDLRFPHTQAQAPSP